MNSKTIEEYTDSLADFLVSHYESDKSSMALYNTWVSRQVDVPNVDTAEKILQLIIDLRQQTKLNKDFLKILLTQASVTKNK